MPLKLSDSSTAVIQVAVVSIFLASAAYARDYSANFTKPLPPDQSIVFENTNLTARDFLNAMMSDSIEDRRYSELYLLGVLDATEGSIWCDYKTYKTITIDERLFANFKLLSQQQLDERAAVVIKNVLRKEFPCGGIK